MRYLIDTNVFIQMIKDTDLITENVKYIIDDYENQIFVSSESIKEFIHLVQIGKISGKKQNFELNVFDFIENSLGFSVKYISKEHSQTFSNLATVEGHNDPSDRLIISQALTEKLTLVSSDRKFPKYRKFGLNFIPNY
ncbi:MAG: type II toxin-antitoxin system VapC family toxin [Dysgonamonadaceae bacterium]|jgi:PIN domain nuclease of toxin-antitoxin system|nr:type II toxin-antitoxin system VapC family toxin [Dysgonamonadaceae bacterium]